MVREAVFSMRSSYLCVALLVSGLASVGCGRVDEPNCGVGGCGETSPATTTQPAPNAPGPPGASGSSCTVVPKGLVERGPAAPTLLAPALRTISVALDADSVYFGTLESDLRGTVYVVAKAGGAARKLADVAAYDLHVVSGRVFAGGGGGKLVAFDKDGSNASTLVERDVFDFDVDSAGDVYWSDLTRGIFRTSRDGQTTTTLAQGESTQGVSLHGGWVYWAEYAKGRIMRVAQGGGRSDVVYETDGYVRSVAFDCAHVFVSVGNYGDATVALELDEAGPNRTLPFVGVGGEMAIDAASLYVVSNESATRVSLASGETTPLGDGPRSPGITGKIAADDDAIYWTSQAGVMRAAK